MTETRHDPQQIATYLDDLAYQLRVAAAAGGAWIKVPAPHCIYLASRIERRPAAAPQNLHVTVDYQPAELATILRASCWLLLLTTIADLALPLARWMAAAL